MGVILIITASMVKYEYTCKCTRCPPQLLSDQSSLPNSGYPSRSICNSFYHRESPSINVHLPQESSQAPENFHLLQSVAFFSFQPPPIPCSCLPQQAITRSLVHRSASMSSSTTTMASHAPCHSSMQLVLGIRKGSPTPAPPGGEKASF